MSLCELTLLVVALAASGVFAAEFTACADGGGGGGGAALRFGTCRLLPFVVTLCCVATEASIHGRHPPTLSSPTSQPHHTCAHTSPRTSHQNA